MARVGTFLFNLICIDAFQSVETGNALLNEKRRRERAILTAYGAWAFFWLLAFMAVPGVGAENPVRPDYILWSLLRAISQGAFGLGTMAAATALWMHASYLGFRRRYKLQRHAPDVGNHLPRA